MPKVLILTHHSKNEIADHYLRRLLREDLKTEVTNIFVSSPNKDERIQEKIDAAIAEKSTEYRAGWEGDVELIYIENNLGNSSGFCILEQEDIDKLLEIFPAAHIHFFYNGTSNAHVAEKIGLSARVSSGDASETMFGVENLPEQFKAPPPKARSPKARLEMGTTSSTDVPPVSPVAGSSKEGKMEQRLAAQRLKSRGTSDPSKLEVIPSPPPPSPPPPSPSPSALPPPPPPPPISVGKHEVLEAPRAPEAEGCCACLGALWRGISGGQEPVHPVSGR